MRRHFVPLLFTALLASCDHASTPIEPSSLPGSRTNFSNGAQRERFDVSPVFFPDDRHGLVFSVGLVTPVEEACADPEHAVFDGVLHIQNVLTSKDRLLERWVTDRATLVIYGTIPENPCLLTEDDVIARGTGKLVFNDNFPIPTGDGTLGFRVVGTVQLADGGRAHFLAISRAIFRGGNERIVVDRVVLKPIGGA